MELNSSLSSLTATQVIENIQEGALVTDAHHNILTVNKTFCDVTGYTLEEVIGKNPRILKSGQHKPIFYKKIWTSLQQNGSWHGEIWNKRKNGELYTEWLSINAIKDKNGTVTHYIGLFTDITKRKRAQEAMAHMAYYDALTNLPNRALFREELNHALAQASRRNELLGVLFLDLDRVKVINDTLGHDMGDKLLKGVAERLRAVIRSTDIVARLGGDEFMLLITGVKRQEEITAITEKILDALRPSFHFDDQELYTTASIGISIYPFDGQDASTLLKNADTAMYRAKRRGRNTYQTFDPSMKAELFQQLTLDNGLRRALEKNEFVIFYQPQINVETGKIVGMEALLRWKHPELGYISPASFIQWAEDSGLILPIGEMVLRKACEQSRQWIDQGYAHLKVGVNVSAKQMRQSNIIDIVEKVLRDTSLPPECLDLELTESVLMEISTQTMNIPLALKSMGVGFSIDDFGTGYSSLSYLKRLPVSTLKLDQSFIRDLTVNSGDSAIATAIIGLGHGLHLNVLAEGVETEGQLSRLRDMHCDQVQGFYFSEPLDASGFESLLKTHQKV